MSFFNIYILAIFMILVQSSKSLSDGHKVLIQSRFLDGGLQCIKDHPLSAEEIRKFRSKMMPDGNNAQCFAACLFKKIGIMDEMGKLTQAGAKENAKQIFSDQEHVKKVADFIGMCTKVNDQVSDDSKGCARAKLAFSCLAKNAPKFGLNLNF